MESDLYLPMKRFLEFQNCEVKGEVHDCDAIEVRGKEMLVIVELEFSLNLNVVLQAVDRLSLTPKVYINIPRHCKISSRVDESKLGAQRAAPRVVVMTDL